MNVRFAVPAAALLVVAGASLARADEAPPNVSPCGAKKAGDACTTDDRKDGACAPQTCTRLDYSKRPPGTASYPCLTCVAGAKATSGAPAKIGCSAAPVSEPRATPLVGLALLLCATVARRLRR